MIGRHRPNGELRRLPLLRTQALLMLAGVAAAMRSLLLPLTIVLATHGLELAERLLTRVSVLREGRIGDDFSTARLDVIRAEPTQSVKAALVAAMH
ncbi:MAG: hypothetical protein IT478_02770 [Xanthomonadales bacterium]|nr:hypothetical protein [Xanthomonadales bacterium]